MTAHRLIPVPILRTLTLGAVLACSLLGCEKTKRVFEPTSGVSPRPAPEPAHAPLGGIEVVAVPGIAGEPDIRVRVQSATTRVRLGVSGESVLYAVGVGTGKPPVRLRVPVEAVVSPEGWRLTDTAGVSASFVPGTEVEIAGDENIAAPASAASPAQPVYSTGALAIKARNAGLSGPVLTLNGVRYAGRLRLVARSEISSRAMDVIEHVNMEDYLRGVVQAEMLRGWPLGAYQAQAVAARSYALHERARARAAGQKFDVEASVADQAYGGSSDLPLVNQAVSETRGVVLTWSGQLLRAYYCSASGGRPASARDTWPVTSGYEFNQAGPLQARAREELGKNGPWYRWTQHRSSSDVLQRLRSWGREKGHPVKNLRSIASIRVEGTNEAGRPTRFVITQSDASTISIGAEQLRWAMNHDAPGLAKVTRETRVHSGDMEIERRGDIMTIQGRGFGHGVGMDQWAVKELTERGTDFREAIVKFYPGAKLGRAY